MWRWTRRVVLGLGVALLVTAAAGAAYQWHASRRDMATVPPPGRLVDVGGHRLHLWCTGTGTPPVILENGLGGSTADWGYVQPGVGAFTQVCSYDRAGMGYSDPGPTPRTARRITAELARLLDAAGVEGPVVVAGASIGGLFARVLASEHHGRVAGLVLVDASHEDQPVEMPGIAPLLPWIATLGAARVAGFALGLPPESLDQSVRPFAHATRFRTAGYRTAVDELTRLDETAAEVKQARRALHIPLVVLTAGLGSDAAWHDWQSDQVRLSRRGCQRIAERSGHAIPLGQPQLVVEAIRDVVRAARGEAFPCDGASSEAVPAPSP
jgi:pimeloyl-ACP methyl ester carboxylesterase